MVAITAPTGLSVNSITANSARVQWTAITGASSYTVEYKTSASTTWTALGAVTTNYRDLTGLSATTVYNWRVKANFPAGSSASTVGVNFTTTVATAACVNNYETNETIATAYSISTNTAYSAGIGSSTDKDYYKFTITSPSDVVVTLTNLPKDYELKLYNSSSAEIGSSTAGGVYSETITKPGLVAGTYYVYIYGYSGNFDLSQCYSLKVAATTAVTPISPPAGLSVSSITANSARVQWTAITGATSYTVEYKTSTSTTWSVLAASSANYRDLTGLVANTTYNWRVKANFPAGSSASTVGSNFNTLVAISAPSGLSVNTITANSARVQWTAITGASSYTVEYKTSTSTTWSVLGASTSNYRDLTGLVANTTYNWRVKANFPAGSSASTVGSNFNTLVAISAPSGLSVNTITANSARVQWTAITGASSYTVEYKTSAATTWTALGASTTNYRDLSGLTASMVYNWRVKANFPAGSSTSTVGTNFTTTAVAAGCVNNYEPNETIATAYSISTNTAYSAGLGSSTDNDYYKFTITSPSDIVVTLTNLPKDYELKLYNSSNAEIGSSRAGGTASESITKTGLAAGTYYVYVYGYSGAFDLTQCYSLKVASTAHVPSCINNYESNETMGTAYPINFTEFKTHEAGIGTSTDVDFYKFTINYAENVSIKLTNLPKDYELVLLNSSGTEIGGSRKGGTSSELIEKHLLAAGTYYVKVYGYSSSYDRSTCYSLYVGRIDCVVLPGTNQCIQMSADEVSKEVSDTPVLVKLYPNPVVDVLHLTGLSETKEIDTQVQIFDQNGKLVRDSRVKVQDVTEIQVSDLQPNIYYLRILGKTYNFIKK